MFQILGQVDVTMSWSDALVQTFLYVGVGLVLLMVGALLTDLLTPGKLGEEIFVKKNLALALVTVGGLLGDGYIVGAVIGGNGDPSTLLPLISSSLSLNVLANTVVYALAGMFVKVLAYKVLDIATPKFSFKTALAENNVAAGFVLGGIFAVIGFVIAAPLHG